MWKDRSELDISDIAAMALDRTVGLVSLYSSSFNVSMKPLKQSMRLERLLNIRELTDFQLILGRFQRVLPHKALRSSSRRVSILKWKVEIIFYFISR